MIFLLFLSCALLWCWGNSCSLRLSVGLSVCFNLCCILSSWRINVYVSNKHLHYLYICVVLYTHCYNLQQSQVNHRTPSMRCSVSMSHTYVTPTSHRKAHLNRRNLFTLCGLTSQKTHRGGLGLGRLVLKEDHPCFPYFTQNTLYPHLVIVF